MFKRLFWLTVGASFGFGSSFWVTRRVQRFIARWTPAGLRERVALRVEEFGADVRDAAVAGRSQMIRREAELRMQIQPSLAPVPAALPAAASVDDEVVDAEIIPALRPGHRPRPRRRRASARRR